MKTKKYYYKVIIILIILICIGCSVSDKYSIAYNLYMKSNYVTAISLYDEFIERSPDCAIATQAELERSDCYYQLGYTAYQKKNWILASRLLYLANSEVADKRLDNCYYELSKEALENKDINTTLNYYNYITTYLKDSELIPEVLFNKIKINIDLNNKLEAYNDYHFLWSNYPESEFTKKVQPIIDELIPFYINEAIAYKDSGYFDQSLDILFKLSQYPTKSKDDILIDISEVYYLKAEESLLKEDFKQAKEYFSKVVEFNPKKENFINQRLDEICTGFIFTGNKLIDEYKFDEAVKIFKECYTLVPDYEKSNIAIEKSKTKKEKYNKAFKYKNEALTFENEKNYAKALNLYKKSYSQFKIKEVQNKIFIMSNLLEAQKNPKVFARSIIQNYKKGIIPEKVRLMENNLIDKYGENVKSSGWKVSYAIGEYKYEVRFDILTPDENYYFAWRVNLKTQDVSPSNKVSEELLKD